MGQGGIGWDVMACEDKIGWDGMEWNGTEQDRVG